MKGIIKYVLLLVVIALVGYKSVYLKKLSTMGVSGDEKFDAVAYTNKLWNEKLPAKLDSAVGLSILTGEIQRDPEKAFQQYSHAMAIGNYRYSIVRFEGRVDSVLEDEIILEQYPDDTLVFVHLNTEFIYGNAVRDASNLVDIRDFTNNTDLNNISEAFNKKVRTEILPAFKKQVKVGDMVEVTGAMKFNKAHPDVKYLEILPVRLKIK